MMRAIGDTEGTAVDTFVVTASRWGDRGLAKASQIVENLQLRLRAVERSHDPEVKQWIAATREQVATGEIARQIEKQPDDPRELIGRAKSS